VPAFSAVGYFFARELNQNLKLPVGIINSSYGASTAQCWIGDGALRSDPRFKPIMDDFDAECAKWDAAHSGGATTQPALPQTEATTRPARGRGASKGPRENQHNPSLLWNAQLKPLEPYAIRGAIWYQGESVVGGTELYLPLMQTLISSWRKEWNQGDFPFLFVQLAAYKAPATQPAPGGGIAKTREAQLQTLGVPDTAMAVTIDIGDAKNVHPKDKQDVGKRLGLAARATVYGEKVEFSGPIYDSMTVEGNAIRLKFTHTQGGLSAKGEKLTGFAIAGGDKKFVRADAKVDGDAVIVSSPGVAEPSAVRYGWADNPPVNLFNGEGLPASPFRTDQW
jgi:sialate O-acetylesterase